MPDSPPPWREVVATAARFLTFRAQPEELAELGHRHLGIGLVATWLVGVGRYWDSPRAVLLQHFGVGSLIYVACLGAFLWLIALPLRPAHWTYPRVVSFVALTAPPGIVYAIPIEWMVPLPVAASLNAWALGLVATWRVALLVFALRRLAQFSAPQIVVTGLLPLTVIVTALSFLNLERAVFNIMAGLGDGRGTSADEAYGIVLTLTFFAWIALPVVLLGYGYLVWRAHRDRRHAASEDRAPPA